MNKIALGNTGESVSQMALGCMLMGSQVDKSTSYEMLDRYIDAGGDFLDTANCYAWWIGSGEFIGDESETLLGEWMKERHNRQKIFLATKAGARLKDPYAIRDESGNVYWERVPHEREFLSAAAIQKAVEGSLRRLQVEVIDLYYAHIDDRHTPLEETLEALNRLVEAGKVRYIGCSNLRTWRLERARDLSIAHGWASYVAIQQQYSYFRPKPGADFGEAVNVDDELLDYLRSNPEVTLVAYSPLLKGIYDDAHKRQAYYNWHLFDNDDARARLETLSQVARELNVTNSQLVLAWLLHHQPQAVTLLGASNLQQYEHNMGALDICLADEHLAALNAASA